MREGRTGALPGGPIGLDVSSHRILRARSVAERRAEGDRATNVAYECNVRYTSPTMRRDTASPRSARLLLLWELPGGKSTRRVAIWRRLQRLGARGVGGAAYELPLDEESRESFEWLRTEISAMGGRCALYEARELAPAIEPPAATVGETLPVADYQQRTWVTRPRPGIDRMGSAWLIRRFVDPDARFGFADRLSAVEGEQVAFDMYGAELGHRAGRCTFEVLRARFGLNEAALADLGRLVRAIDLHEEAPDPAEAALVERLVAGLRASIADDAELLAAGMSLFEALYSGPPRRAGAGRRAAAPRTGRARKAERRKR